LTATDPATIGRYVIRLLEAYGVDLVFGIPGVHTLELYRGLEGSGIRHVLVRHEQGAGFAADGYARVTGKPGVCLLISGPGVTNAATPMGQAYSDSQPMLVISSTCSSDSLGQGWGMLHEVTDQRATTAPLTAFSRTARSAEEVGDSLAEAFAVFASERPRPVHIEIPIDVLARSCNLTPVAKVSPAPPTPDESGIAAAAGMLSAARSPAIVVGGGARAAGSAIAEIAEALGAPIATTLAGKGCVPDDHPLHLGAMLHREEVRELLRAADVVLALGTELAETDTWSGALAFEGRLIRVDIDPAKFADRTPAALGIHADAGAAATAIAAAIVGAVAGAAPSGADAARQVAALRARFRDDADDLSRRHRRFLEPLRAALPEDGVVVADMTQIAYTGGRDFPTSTPGGWLCPNGYGTLGFALPAAIGAKLGAPERPIVALAGDAGLLFTVQELATAVQENLSLPILVWNNDALGQIRDDMIAQGIAELGVIPRNPDFIALGRAFGCRTAAIREPGDLGPAVTAALAAPGPTLIEIRDPGAIA
jgi:thiamine pyrophosphate-dependent acetolactate synthase large subunit-like protein